MGSPFRRRLPLWEDRFHTILPCVGASKFQDAQNLEAVRLIDIGANLTNRRFRGDLDAVIARAREAGVVSQVVTGTSESGSRAALDLVRAHPGLHSTAGVHPHDADRCGETTLETLRSLAAEREVVAIGECGLDFNRNFSPPEDQERWFARQLDLAVEIGKPVFLHERDAHTRFVEILAPRMGRLKGAVVHCFTGTGDELETCLRLGCHIGITGWICDDRRGTPLREIVARIPAERLLVETDAPYLTPPDVRPKPKGRRNEPAFLPHVVRAVAAARGEDVESLAEQTYRNSVRFFGLVDH